MGKGLKIATEFHRKPAGAAVMGMFRRWCSTLPSFNDSALV
jgi:hypothetical protein